MRGAFFLPIEIAHPNFAFRERAGAMHPTLFVKRSGGRKQLRRA